MPFHHTVLGQNGVNNLVLGYAHCGMVAAARWISQKASEKILQAQKDHPSYQIKVSLVNLTCLLSLWQRKYQTYILWERFVFCCLTLSRTFPELWMIS